MEFFYIQLDYIGRILGAMLCGLLVGYERENHLKTAGIRTHTIVALASAVMMIISKYGFSDVLRLNHVDLDPSRIAAGIVTAIGFLGAGIIFTHNMNVSGLTTSAGLWATVGIGMSFGAGMYVLGLVTTVLILIIHLILRHNFRFMKPVTVQQITLEIAPTEDIKQILKEAFEVKKMKILTLKVTRVDTVTLKIRLNVAFPDNYSYENVLEMMKEHPQIKSVDM